MNRFYGRPQITSIREAIEARGAELRFLPPHSPDLNPIEQAFAKLKALLRQAAERTVDGLWTAIGRLLDLFPPHECANYLVNAGYPRSACKCSSVARAVMRMPSPFRGQSMNIARARNLTHVRGDAQRNSSAVMGQHSWPRRSVTAE